MQISKEWKNPKSLGNLSHFYHTQKSITTIIKTQKLENFLKSARHPVVIIMLCKTATTKKGPVGVLQHLQTYGLKNANLPILDTGPGINPRRTIAFILKLHGITFNEIQLETQSQHFSVIPRMPISIPFSEKSKTSSTLTPPLLSTYQKQSSHSRNAI